MSAPITELASAPITVQELEAELVVAHREEAADGVAVIDLADPDGGTLSGWTPGAHIDLLLAPSLVRQYSLCSTPGDVSTWRIGVLRDPQSRGGSQFIHDELHPGVRVRVRGPRNHFPLVKAPRYQFIAGGIGITPMIPMIEAADASGADWHLLYGGRERASMAFVDQLAEFGERVTVWPQDQHGMLDLPSVLGTPRDETLVYCCGPEGLLGAVEAGCAGWPGGTLHIERFAAKPQAEAAEGALETFEVVCQRSGVTVTCTAGVSILSAIQDAGVSMLASCMEGICGTCEAEVLEGTPDHRDSVLTDDEKAANDVMMICVSRSASERLVLDI